jgi:small subunit ribosomal protein S13
MIRISGVTLNPNKQARFGLSLIKGIGKSNVKKILQDLNIPFDKKLRDLDEDTVIKLRNHIESKYLVEADLRRQIQANIKRLIDIGTYRGSRHKSNLPVRGQRTRVNSRTVRGNRRNTAGSGRAKAPAKT